MNSKISIDVDDFISIMRALDDTQIESLMDRHDVVFSRGVINTVKVYPPPVGYPRTGHLGRSWYYNIRGTDIEFGNTADYAEEVQGDSQKQFHRRTGWKVLSNVIEDKADEFVNEIENKLDDIWR